MQDDALLLARFGKPMAKYIRLRLDALHAAGSLNDFWPARSKPERIHELGGKLNGIFSMDLKQPYRLLFKPIFAEEIVFENEQERWKNIKKIQIVSIEDTHG